MSDRRWFLRMEGKVRGPFTLAQLQSLQQAGRVRAQDEVSSDKQTWAPVAALHELEVCEVTPVEGEWFYADKQGQRQGPVTETDLFSLLQRGEITLHTLVWRQGLAAWVMLNDPQTALTQGIKKLLSALCNNASAVETRPNERALNETLDTLHGAKTSAESAHRGVTTDWSGEKPAN